MFIGRVRLFGRLEQQSVWLFQIDRERTFSVSFQFMAAFRPRLGRPEIAQGIRSTAFVNSNSPFSDQYGFATHARFKGTLQNLGHPEYKWAGNRVKESGSASDGCIQSGDPFEPVKNVTGGVWYVQSDQHYEPDFVGYGPTIVAWLQQAKPERLPCSLTAQQQMSMYTDNVAANNPAASTATPYGAANTGDANTLQITVTSPGITVSRAGVSAAREFHF